MRKLLTIITIAIFILSCSNKENKNNDKQKGVKTYSETESKKIIRNHEILNVILNRWAPLINKKLVGQNRSPLPLKQIVLVPKSITNISYDTTDNGFSIKPHRFSLADPPLCQIQRDTILKQIKQSTPTIWNSVLIYSTIRIDPSLTEEIVSFPGKLHDKYSFLVISEPIEFSKNVFFVSGLLYTKKILLDNLYIIEKVGDRWKVTNVETAVIKLEVGRTKPFIDKKGLSGEETTLTAIFDGYLGDK
jgi:hypothetical protein